jgi:hypothetical protein
MNIINIPNFDGNLLNNNYKIFYTNILSELFESKLNNLIDKFDFAKYYIHCNNSFWLISFKMDSSQFEEMIESSVKIKLCKDINNKSIVLLSNNINEYQEWIPLKEELNMFLFKNKS